MESIRVHLPEDLRMDDDEFMRFCQDNPDLKFERRKNGDIVFIANTGGVTGSTNFEIAAHFAVWNWQVNFGKFFDSSTAFRLPDTSIMSPDVSAIAQSRWDALTPEQRVKIVPLCPDFVLELRFQSDRLKDSFEKMDDWMANGCRLAWLLDLANQTTYIYRPNQTRQEATGPVRLSGENVFPASSLIWPVLFRQATTFFFLSSSIHYFSYLLNGSFYGPDWHCFNTGYRLRPLQ